MYKNFAKTAKEEGFDDISETFRHVRVSEQHHAKRYRELLENLTDGTLFKKDRKQEWICRKCGYVYFGMEAPLTCPSCHHPRAYFELLCEKY